MVLRPCDRNARLLAGSPAIDVTAPGVAPDGPFRRAPSDVGFLGTGAPGGGRACSGGVHARWIVVGRPLESRRVRGHGHLSGPGARGSKATLTAPLWSWRAKAFEGVPPALEGEPVGEHSGQVDPAGDDQIEIVGDGVLANALNLLDGEGVGPGQVSSLKYIGVHSHRPGVWHAALDEGAPLGQHPHPDFEGLGAGDGVVDDVDVPRMGDGQPVEGTVQHAPGPRRELLHHRQAGLVRHHLGRAHLRVRASAWAAKRATTATSTSG